MFLRPVKSAAQSVPAQRKYDAVWLAQEVHPAFPGSSMVILLCGDAVNHKPGSYVL